jgi:PPOX class probable F420-dependent enzyme
LEAKFPLGQGQRLTPEELHEFLTGTKIFVKVATIGPDGWPAVSPSWYEYDGEAFWIVTKKLAGFCQNMLRDPRVTLLIDNPEPPYKRVIVRGRAEAVERDDTYELGRRLVLRYLGPQGLDYFEATGDLPRIVIRIVPEQVTSWNGGGVDRTFFKPSRWHDVPAGESLEEAAQK